SVGKDAIVVRCDGHGTSELLTAILKLMPLDQYTDKPATLMEVVPGDPCETPIWKEYEDIIAKYDKRGASTLGTLERFAFYDEA
ncbi:RbsD/FucU domain-containing protein, partial [Escherichia coli]|nr:RbsD/FucU domain-containing protein [Escherichia coli]